MIAYFKEDKAANRWECSFTYRSMTYSMQTGAYNPQNTQRDLFNECYKLSKNAEKNIVQVKFINDCQKQFIGSHGPGMMCSLADNGKTMIMRCTYFVSTTDIVRYRLNSFPFEMAQ
jgi:hypothetical protein